MPPAVFADSWESQIGVCATFEAPWESVVDWLVVAVALGTVSLSPPQPSHGLHPEPEIGDAIALTMIVAAISILRARRFRSR